MMKDRTISRSLFGAVVGDSLGYRVEFDIDVSPINRKVDGLDPTDMWSDDTQLMCVVAEGFLKVGYGTHGAVVEAIGKGVAEWAVKPRGGHRSPGGTCLRGARNILLGVAPTLSGDFNPSTGGGCGAAMRSAPYAWFAPTLEKAVEWAAEGACMTHGAPIGQASAAAVAAAVYVAGTGGSKGQVAEAAMHAAGCYDNLTARLITEGMWLSSPLGRNLHPPVEVFRRFRGWAGHEAVAAAVYAFLATPTLEQALLLSANTPGDSDSIACICGAIAGAYYPDMIREDWRFVVEDREYFEDLSTRILSYKFHQCECWCGVPAVEHDLWFDHLVGGKDAAV